VSKPSTVYTINIGNRPLRNYVLEAIVNLNQGADIVEIVGRGRHIHRAVNVFNAIASRLGDSVKLEGVEIGSILVRGRRVSYIKIRIRRV